MTKDTELAAWEQAMLHGYLANAAPAAAPAATRADKARAYSVPLHERLKAALTKFPPEVLAEGLHMSQIWPLVSGRQRSKPRAFEVADALRQLGWQRLRLYSDSTMPSGTWWFPAGVLTGDAKAAMRRRKS